MVSLAPALILATGVTAAKADVVVQDKLIDQANEYTINSASGFYNTSPTTHAPNGSGTGNYYYVDFADINPQDLDEQKTILVTDATGMTATAVIYSPVNYMANIYNNANSSVVLKQLMVAMYNYNLAANEYVA